ncbi:hypothetical protein [Paenibacillus sp. SSG-1]|uniref:hypothetical protein n=1 Tax=Paenibacillus sp. SSG-1 TaxID=1443669 RepID=UPI001C52AE02|nr:hypothetical protein [Paenibacillus sp. SSG-1]
MEKQDNLAVLGPEDLSCEDMAKLLTEALGTPIRFEQMYSTATSNYFLAWAIRRPCPRG